MNETPTWREKLVCRILLLIARMLAPNAPIAEDIKHLSNHITLARATDD